ncbi:MAG: chemotaxis protein CheW [Ferrovibrio sp.]|uniref:chemotaxis protein CheW n=1 Tax=Ferrovibrio sp. TaxID=1917215 RepID=UPI0026174CFA|nr:chemotaxis protein CheW [Ferrovibrio sp.]MCW0235112.1 chemotaxis protein CheW [Ferrovibrio sp.]
MTDRTDALLINVGDQTYALPLLQIQEIRGWSPVSPLPNTDSACLGVLNLRGHVLPVFDARPILGKPTAPPTPQDVIVVAVMDEKPLGLLVDSVSDIIEIEADKISRADQGEAWSSGLIDGIATVGERLVPLLALQKLTGSRMPAQLPNTAPAMELIEAA